MAGELNWGILGTGNIAGQFAAGVAGAKRSRVVAVGSRSDSNAKSFAERFKITKAHGSYEALLADASVQAVYVSTPNSSHHRLTIAALEAGKHVLCEKPIAMNASEAREMFAAANRAGRRLMEAFMYRTHPLMRSVMERIHDGAIGTPKLVRTSFCYRTTRIAGNVRFDRKLGGGALMDVGCYCVNLARLVAGQEPVEVSATAVFHTSGVDEQVTGWLRFPSGLTSTFTCGMAVHADNAAHVCGDEGYIIVPAPWKPPVEKAEFIVGHSATPRQDLTPVSAGKAAPVAPPSRAVSHIDAGMPLYAIEADEFARHVLDDAPAPITAADSIGNMETLDRLRAKIGLHFD